MKTLYPNYTILRVETPEGIGYQYRPTICLFDEGVIWQGEEYYFSGNNADPFLSSCAQEKARATMLAAFRSLFKSTEADITMDARLAEITSPLTWDG